MTDQSPLERELKWRRAFIDNLQGKLIICVNPTGAPIPIRNWDWEAHVDGEEERGSALGETKWDALRALIDQMEANDA